MNYTAQQKREIFYQAAENIEARPDLYDFDAVRVGDPDCPACMWGHVGRVMGLPVKTNNIDTAEVLDVNGTGALYCARKFGENQSVPASAAAILRRFADKHWPAEQQAMSFAALMDRLLGEKA